MGRYVKIIHNADTGMTVLSSNIFDVCLLPLPYRFKDIFLSFRPFNTHEALKKTTERAFETWKEVRCQKKSHTELVPVLPNKYIFPEGSKIMKSVLLKKIVQGSHFLVQTKLQDFPRNFQGSTAKIQVRIRVFFKMWLEPRGAQTFKFNNLSIRITKKWFSKYYFKIQKHYYFCYWNFSMWGVELP